MRPKLIGTAKEWPLWIPIRISLSRMGTHTTVMVGKHGSCHEWETKLKAEYKQSIPFLLIL